MTDPSPFSYSNFSHYMLLSIRFPQLSMTYCVRPSCAHCSSQMSITNGPNFVICAVTLHVCTHTSLFCAARDNLGPRPPPVEVSKSHTHARTRTYTHTGVIGSSQWPLPTKGTTNTRDEHFCLQRDLNPQSQKSSGRRPTPQTAGSVRSQCHPQGLPIKRLMMFFH